MTELKTFRMTATMTTDLEYVFKAPAGSDLDTLEEHLRHNVCGGSFEQEPSGGHWEWGYVEELDDPQEETENIITEELLGA